MKTHFIYIILILVMIMTLFNLYYKPILFPISTTTTSTTIKQWGLDPLEVSLCPLRGFKCPDSQQCECNTICRGYEKINVMPGDYIVLFDEKITPGTYCVPKGISSCNRTSSIPILSTSGWMCRNKMGWQGNYRSACKSSKAQDNSLNVLIDTQTGLVAAAEISNYYEKLPDGSRKFKCHCGSLDQNGNAMLEILPFVCSSDYCIEDIPNASSHFGWKGNQCHCGGLYPHKDEEDPTSPCLSMKTEIRENQLVGRVNCMTEKSIKEFPIYCPNQSTLPYLTFKKRIGVSEDYTRYLTQHFETFEALM